MGAGRKIAARRMQATTPLMWSGCLQQGSRGREFEDLGWPRTCQVQVPRTLYKY